MSNMSRILTTTTDDNGYFSVTKEYDPRGWSPFDFKIRIWVKLLEPVGTTIHGTLDIDAADGSPSNRARSFEVASGEEEYLGRWTVDLNKTVIVVRGNTQPKAPNATVKVRARGST